MEAFEYFVNGVQKDRWRDVNNIGETATLLLERIKTLVPTGNTPSIGFPKQNVGLLYNLMSDVIHDINTLLEIIREITDKAIFKLTFTSDGTYGYYEDINNLVREILRREGLTDATMKKIFHSFYYCPKTQIIFKKPYKRMGFFIW